MAIRKCNADGLAATVAAWPKPGALEKTPFVWRGVFSLPRTFLLAIRPKLGRSWEKRRAVGYQYSFTGYFVRVFVTSCG
jgi:hypothetical protein